MSDFTCTPVKTDDALRVLQSDGLFTFAVNVDGVEYHQQLSIKDFGTRDAIEKQMAVIGAQVADEVSANKKPAVPDDVLALIS